MINKVYRFIKKNNMIEPGSKVLVGLSGGADSVCLLTMLYELRNRLDIEISCVHVNHCIRGEEALRDEQFCKELCEKLGLELTVVSKDVKGLADKWNMTLEEAGRKVRYEAFNEMVKEEASYKIAVAHHMNDQAETVLFNMLRGSGLKGLSGMKPVNGKIIRPLLCVGRAEIESELKLRNIDFVTDSTNLETEYTRNKLRNKILPEMSEINSEAVVNVVKASELCGEAWDYISKQSLKSFEEISENYQDGYRLCIERLNVLEPIIRSMVVQTVFERIYVSLKDLTRDHIDSVIRLAGRKTGKRVNLPGGVIAKNQYGWIYIYHENKNVEAVNLPRYRTELISWNKDKDIVKNDCTKYFDYDKIKGMLELRTRNTGDYLVVDSKGSKKKLKDYFIDAKIPRDMRDSIPLLAEGNHILWVVGYRISEAYKIDENTTKAISITIYNEMEED